MGRDKNERPDLLSGVRRQWAADRALRPPMRSPGRPYPRKDVERAFWRWIAEGLTSEAAAAAVGVWGPVGSRWFRHGGGMPPLSLVEPTGRYLSFAEREEIALQAVQGSGVRQIARRLGRDASTISRGVAPQRRHPQWDGGVPGVGRAVARRAPGAPAESGQAVGQ